MAVVADRDAAVLGVAAVGDVELAHDLQAARDRGHQPRRHLGDHAHDAVDPRPHDHRVRLRLEVDVGGALGDRVGDDLVRQLDRRRVGGVALGDVLDGLFLLRDATSDSISTATFARKQRSSVRARSETETTTKRICRPSARRRSSEAITSVGSVTATTTVPSSSNAIGSAERRLATFSGSRLVAAGTRSKRLELEELEAVLLGEGPRDRRAGGDVVAEQDLAEPAAFGLLLGERGGELLGGDDAVAHEQRAELLPALGPAVRIRRRRRRNRRSFHAFVYRP